MEIDRREPVQLGEGTEWIRIRAANARNPLLLLVQMGPGLPMLNEARTFGRVLSLEDDFTVVYNSMGRSLLFSLLRSPDYSLADTVRSLRGVTAARAALLPELAALDLTHTLTRLDTPIVMAQGRHDQVAPPFVAERYAELLQAPSKQLVWFEHSAHMPHLEEPGRFQELLAKVRLGLPAEA
jgi:pimeloyl-ACP methyl ester carboxylesterase